MDTSKLKQGYIESKKYKIQYDKGYALNYILDNLLFYK